MESTPVQSQTAVVPAPYFLSGSLTASFRKKPGIILFFLLSFNISFAQDSILLDNGNKIKNKSISFDGKIVTTADLIGQQRELNSLANPYLHFVSKKEYKTRQWLIGGINAAGYGSSLIILSNTWYKNYPHSSFHTFNDVGEWMQVDKFGHSWTAYNTGKASAAMWKWAGLNNNKATWIGGLSGTAYLTVIEFLDGHSAEWGWSWGDMAANIFGSGLFISQQLLWQEQRIQYKFSFHRNNYGDPQLEKRSDDLFGSSWYERMLKDYNAQTYWFSVNLKSFFPKSNLPAWLNVSVGYGADGMFGGFDNTSTDANGNIVFDRRDIPRKRQFYIAPDIDFTKIKTKSKLLKTVFTALNAFKCPAPTLMLDSKGKLKGYLIYF